MGRAPRYGSEKRRPAAGKSVAGRVRQWTADEEGRQFAFSYLAILPTIPDLKKAENIGAELGPLKRHELSRLLELIISFYVEAKKPLDQMMPSPIHLMRAKLTELCDEFRKYGWEIDDPTKKPRINFEVSADELMEYTVRNFVKKYATE
jgi:hypothetical protein